jgi:outer membrane protein OmpA-like peptidoglycan-associated protein
MKLITALLIGLLAGPAFAQVAIPPAQPSDINAPTPLFRLTVVGRTTAAINYRPRSGHTKVDLVGTALLPEARGYADVSGEKGYIEIDAHFRKMQPATRFGTEYLTYVMWAITPEGRAKNLGEVQIDDDDARIQVTTEFQAFALIVTAEPYFAVTQPSDVVVMENLVRDDTKGKVETVQAKYELLKRGSYLMNQSATFKVKPLEPGAPLDLAEARNAVELARLANADRYAADSFAKAQRLLSDAEVAREKRKRGNDVMMPARQAAQTAEDARLIALQRQEDEFIAQERARAADRERAALVRAAVERDRAQAERERAQAEETRRRQAELDVQTAAAAREAAERERLEIERSRQDALKAQSDAERARAEAEAAKQAADAAKLAADAEAQQARAQAQQAQAAAAQAEQEKAALRQRLREQLNVVLETRETARGLIVNVSDVLFDTASATLKPGAREKLARVAGILASHPDLKIEIEGHTDSVGGNDYNQRLSERRAESVRSYLVTQKIPPTAVDAEGFGESRPVATNATTAGRQQNRRVELVVSGESIGQTVSRAPAGQ